jgi:arsenate reductase (glutaredoxin)
MARALPSRSSGAFAMTTTIYGIKNCDTMRKAFTWLDQNRVGYAFHDYKKDGVERTQLEAWCKKLGWEALLNRAGMTFRKLSEKDKEGLNAGKAIKLMLEHPSMIKRPVLEAGGRLLVGFKPDEYKAALKARGHAPE